MNYTLVPARKSCNQCGNINDIKAEHCSACGKSFVFGKPDAWKQEVYVGIKNYRIDPEPNIPIQVCLKEAYGEYTQIGKMCTCQECMREYNE